jgi:hypothetical protein
VINNRLKMTIVPEKGVPCEFGWCPNEAHYRVLSQANNTGDFNANFCAHHLLSIIQNTVDSTEERWAKGFWPEGKDPLGHLQPVASGDQP